MKKFILSVLFAIGFFAISQAQTLFYTVNNSSTYAWDFKIGDGNGNGQYNPPFFGTINNGWGNFGFQLEFGGTNSLGCTAYANLTSAPASGNIPITCFVPTNWSYNLTFFPGFGVYFLNVQIT